MFVKEVNFIHQCTITQGYNYLSHPLHDEIKSKLEVSVLWLRTCYVPCECFKDLRPTGHTKFIERLVLQSKGNEH
jgi:hypothetical protein